MNKPFQARTPAKLLRVILLFMLSLALFRVARGEEAAPPPEGGAASGDAKVDSGKTSCPVPGVGKGEAGKKPYWEVHVEELLKKREVFEAIKYLHERTGAEPSNPEIRLVLLRILDEGGERDAARVVAMRAAEACPDDFRCQLLGGMGFEKTGDNLRAEDCYKRAVELDPSAPDARRLLISFYTAAQRFNEAVSAAGAAVDAMPEEYEVLKAAAAAYYGAGIYSDGENLRKKIAAVREKKLAAGNKTLKLDEYVFHLFPADEKGDIVKVYDNFSWHDNPTGSAVMYSFRVFSPKGASLRAFLLERLSGDGDDAAASYVLREYSGRPGKAPVILRDFGDSPPPYTRCLALVMESLRKRPPAGE